MITNDGSNPYTSERQRDEFDRGYRENLEGRLLPLICDVAYYDGYKSADRSVSAKDAT